MDVKPQVEAVRISHNSLLLGHVCNNFMSQVHEHKKVEEADIRSAIDICSRALLSKELQEHKSFRQQI